jgi:TolB-like protein
MKKTFYILLLTITLSVSATAKCGAEKKETMKTLEHSKAVSTYVNVISKKIAEQFSNNIVASKRKTISIAIQPIKNLYDSKKTSIAVQKIEENLLHAMFVKGFKMLSSDTKQASCIMQGTYANYKDGMLVNARVVDKKSKEIYTSAQVFVTTKELRAINKIYGKYNWFSEN